MVPDGNSRAIRHICRNTVHALGIESGLELGGHEAVTIAGVTETGEVDDEHGHVECNRDNNKAEHACEKVLEPETGGDVLGITQEKPQLESSQASNPGNSEQANPLHTNGSSEAQSSHGQPEPPIG